MIIPLYAGKKLGEMTLDEMTQAFLDVGATLERERRDRDRIILAAIRKTAVSILPTKRRRRKRDA